MAFIRQKLRSYGSSVGDISTDRLYGLAGGVYDDTSHAGDMSNMISDGDGSVKKRCGYSIYTANNAPDSIGSVHIYKKYGGDVLFYLSDKNIRIVMGGVAHDTPLPFDATDMKSIQLDRFMLFVGGALIIADCGTGTVNYWYKREQGGGINPAYVPTLYIANTPLGAGHAYEAVNLIGNKVAEQYAGDGVSVKYHTHLNGTLFEAYIKGTDGSWSRVWPKTIGTNYVEFETAPKKPDVTGEDNVRLVYCYEGYEDAYYNISSCGCAAVFGVGGMADRAFLSASVANPGKVFYSHMDNPLYFADIDYIKVGDIETDVYAMNRRADTLAVVTDGLIYTVTGTEGQTGAIKQDAVFAITDVYSTPEPIGVTDTCIFMDEPVYLTKDGVCAVTTSGILDERCADIRSGTINSLLLKEDLKLQRLLVYRDMLYIYGSERIYLLDGRQYKTRGSERMYEGYVWDGIPAKYMWVHEDRLFFTDGVTIYRFNTGESKGDYSDERQTGKFYPISAYWQTKRLYPSDFKDFKFFTRVGIKLDADTGSDIRISAEYDNDKPRCVMDYSNRFSRIDYGSIDYRFFTYIAGRPCEVGVARLLHKKGRGVALRLENGKINCPMKITAFGAEYMKM